MDMSGFFEQAKEENQSKGDNKTKGQNQANGADQTKEIREGQENEISASHDER